MILPKRLPNQENYNKYKTKSIIKKKLTNQKTINTQTREKIILRQPKNLL